MPLSDDERERLVENADWIESVLGSVVSLGDAPESHQLPAAIYNAGRVLHAVWPERWAEPERF